MSYTIAIFEVLALVVYSTLRYRLLAVYTILKGVSCELFSGIFVHIMFCTGNQSMEYIEKCAPSSVVFIG